MTDLQKEQIIQLRRGGLGFTDIAQAVGVPRNTVKSYCYRNKVEAQEEPVTMQTEEMGEEKEPVEEPEKESVIMQADEELVLEPAIDTDDIQPYQFLSPTVNAYIELLDPDPVVLPAKAITEVCLQCGVPLVKRRNTRKFCSDTCRMKWWHAHPDRVKRSEDAHYTFTCACCGKEFTVYGKDHRKYCSRECYIQDRFYTTA